MSSLNAGLLSNFILCYLSIYGHAALEPQCSKFAYEESLLEKMVRMEFAVEKMLEGVKDVESRVKEEVNKLQSERHAFEREKSEFMDKIKQVEDSVANKLQELTNDVDIKFNELEGRAEETILNLTSGTQSKFVQLKNDLDENLKYSEDVITRLSSDVWDLKNGTIKEILGLTNEQWFRYITATWIWALLLENQPSRIRSVPTQTCCTGTRDDSSKRPTIFFRARNLNDLSPSNNQKLIFQTIFENQGQGYSKDTGIFKAPVDGEYLFSVQLCSYDQNDFNFAFMENGVIKQPAQFENRGYGCGTSIFVTKVKVNTEVWVESKGSYTNDRLYAGSDRWNIFSGILIK